jgi:hypothetical protein
MLPDAGERGIAVIATLLALVLVSALGTALLMLSGGETLAAANYRDALVTSYAAEAAIEEVLPDLQQRDDWNPLLTSPDEVRAATIAAFSGPLTLTLADGHALSFAALTARANCPQVVPPPPFCSDAQMNANSADRPWGRNNPRWRLYAWGPFDGTLPDVHGSGLAVAVWLADDPSENDDNPSLDGSGAGNRGAGTILVRADSFGPRGSHARVETTVTRTGGTSGDPGYTGQRGDDELNRGVRGGAVGQPGRELSRRDVVVQGGD